jgi:hypothetical protein
MAGNDTENLTLNTAIEDLYKDQFISTTEKAIQRYESMLGIIPKGTDTLEDRRFRILALYNKQLPYTRIVLEQNLTTFCGKNGYKLFLDYSSKVLTVKIALTAKSMYDTVKSYLEGVVPMNLIIDLILLYNQYKLLKQFTHKQLNEFTHKQLREDVII